MKKLIEEFKKFIKSIISGSKAQLLIIVIPSNFTEAKMILIVVPTDG